MWIRSLLFLVVVAVQFSQGYRLCNDNHGEKEVKKAVEEIIQRLMALRNPDWNWKVPQTPMALQVAAPERFIGREKTVEKIREKLKNEAQNMSLLQLALHTTLVKGLCHDTRNFSGMDLAKMVEGRLLSQFRYTIRQPVEGFQAYAVGIGSLCLSNYPVKKYLINKLLLNQNFDGSFGMTSVIATTSLLLPPIHCVVKQGQPRFRARRLYYAMKKMREFLKTKVHTDIKNHTYVGNSYTSTFALMGLHLGLEDGETPEAWKCREVMESLGIYPQPHEPEIVLVSRLLRISGHGYFYFNDPEWKCLDPGPIPPGYRPTCRPEVPATCRLPKGPKHKED